MNNMTWSLALLAASAALCGNVAYAQRSLTTANPITENFSSYLGTLATVPSDFIVEYEAPANPFQGTGTGINNNSGFYAYTNAGGTAFGILEGDQGTGDLGDSRLFLHFQNSTGSAISRLHVRYKVQIWRDGPRLNRIRLKYNTSTGGFSSLPDLADTPAPVNAGGDVAYNGNDPTYYTQVDTVIVLPAPLANGASAYLRWQYSSSGDSGRRDGIGITDIEVAAAAAGTPQDWQAGDGSDGFWNLSDQVWGDNDTAWNNSSDFSAVFGDAGGTVTLEDNITAVDLTFNADDYLIEPASTQVLTLKGSVAVDTGLTATITAPIAGNSGLIKTGAGTLELGSVNTFTGTLAVTGGTVSLLVDDAIPAGNVLQLGDNAVLALNGHDLTVNGVQGDALGNVQLGGGKLTLDTSGAASYKGNISGSGDVEKTGTGRQRFRNQVKTYTGITTISDGALEITENSFLTGTTGVAIVGGGVTDSELLLTTDAASTTFVFGPSGTSTILLSDGGRLASDTNKNISLTNPISIGTGGGAIYARGTQVTARLTLNGAISGADNFSRHGQGVLTLTANSSSYSGNIALNNGTTVIASGVTLGNGSITVTVQGDNSSELAGLTGPGTIGGSVAYAANSVIAISGVSSPLNITGNLSGLTNATITGSGTNVVVFRVSGSVTGGIPSGVTLDTTTEPGFTLVKITN
ncbi:autotransporter-associated beta strand repeat protein [Opitutaceae bacterium TAV1]|nr:autotransporter-associated beta strand repeat protein [Opitutaceae bacterium TAV1]